MNEEVSRKAVRELLETSRKLAKITEQLKSDPIGAVLGELADIIWGLYNVQLQDDQCFDGFIEVVFEYQDGEIMIEQCMDLLDEFCSCTAVEDKKVR